MAIHRLKYSIYLFLFGSSFALFSQGIDNPNGGGNGSGKIIGVIEAPAKEVKKPISLEPENDNGFKTANKKLQKQRKKQQAEQELEKKGIITPEMVAKQNFKKNFEGKLANYPMIDMDLGSFHTDSEFVYISSYDFGRFDGDKVSISVNGKRIHNNYLLTPKIKTIKIPLEIGINKVEVTALNEGQLSPNTGYFAFFESNKQVIKEGEWMLATGAKVIAIVVRNEK